MPSDTKNVVLNDVLAFVSFKMKVCPRDTLLNIVNNYYSKAAIKEARDILYEEFSDDARRLVKHTKLEDMLISIYEVLQGIPSERSILFTVLNLNNIPCVDLKNLDGASIIHKQYLFEEKLSSFCKEQQSIQEQLKQLAAQVQKLCSEKQYLDSVVCQNNHLGTPCITLPETSPSVKERARLFAGQQRERSDSKNFAEREFRAAAATNTKSIGKKKDTRLRTAIAIQKASIFISRLDPSTTCAEIAEYAESITGTVIEVEQLQTRYTTYASFKLTCSKQETEKLLQPDEWQEGILIKPFFEKRNINRDNN